MATTTQDVLERYLAKSAVLSRYQMPDKVIPLGKVLEVLNRAKVSFVLVGAHGLAGWRKKPRATEDVDVIVASKHLRKAVEALQAAFADLEPVELPMVIRMRDRDTQDVAIDIMKPLQQPYREAFKHTRSVEVEEQAVRIPSLEMALTMKFSAMISPYRAEEDKLLDAHDFIHMVKANREYDREKLAEIGTLLYAEGGKDVVEMARKALSGEQLVL